VGRATSLGLAVAALVAALMPATAHAWGEVGTRAAENDAVAGCLSAAGQGVLSAAFGSASDQAHFPQLFMDLAGGMPVVGATRPGSRQNCPAVAQGPDGTQVVADIVERGVRQDLVAVLMRHGLRERIVVQPDVQTEDPLVSVSVSPQGDVLVAWDEDVATDPTTRTRVVAALAPAGAGFGTPQPLTPWVDGSSSETANLLTGVDAAGTFTVAFDQPVDARDSVRIVAATARRGERFGPLQVILARTAEPELDLAVAPDGGALLAVAHDFNRIEAAERPPGGEAFGALARVPRSQASMVDQPAVALVDGGAAVVAWRLVATESSGTGIEAMTRPAGGRFAEPKVVARPHRRTGLSSIFRLLDLPIYTDRRRLTAAIGSNGRAVLAWGTTRNLGSDHPAAAAAAAGTVAAGFGAPVLLGGPCRSANGVAAALTKDGAPVAAWTDNLGAPLIRWFGVERPGYAGSVHLAAPGAPPARSSKPPRIRVSAAPQRATLMSHLKVRARCDSACDLRATARSSLTRTDFGTARLKGPGTTEIVVAQPFPLLYEVPRRTRIVTVHACAPNGTLASSAKAVLHLSPVLSDRVPQPIDLTVTGRHRSLVVRWRTAKPVHGVDFYVDVVSNEHVAPVGQVRVPRNGPGRGSFRAVIPKIPPHLPVHYRAIDVVASLPSGAAWPKRARVPLPLHP
jgi:hypothetical protein